MAERFELVFLRDRPLSPTEHRALADLEFRWSRRRWRHLEGLHIEGMDGFGAFRARLSFTYGEPDLRLEELPEVARLCTEVATQLSGARARIRDPRALFARRNGVYVAADPKAERPKPLHDGWQAPPEARLDPPGPVGTHPISPDPEQVSLLGRRILEARAPADVHDDWDDGDDDLSVDALLLEPDADDDVPVSPLSRALRKLYQELEEARFYSTRQGPNLEAATAVAGLAGFSRRCLDALQSDDATVAGACFLLATDAWPIRAVPGLIDALTSVARSERPVLVRALALRALARSARPDALRLLLDFTADADPDLASEAVRGLARFSHPEAVLAIRRAMERSHTAAHAVAAAAERGDVAAFETAASLARHPRTEVRRAVARFLDRIGGARAVPFLEPLFREDPAWQVRLEAAQGLARNVPISRLDALLGAPDADLVAHALIALGEAGRVEALSQVVEATAHPRAGVRLAAVEALGRLKQPEGVPALIDRLDDVSHEVVRTAIAALALTGDLRAEPALQRLSRRPDDAGIAARAALEALRQPARTTITSDEPSEPLEETEYTLSQWLDEVTATQGEAERTKDTAPIDDSEAEYLETDTLWEVRVERRRDTKVLIQEDDDDEATEVTVGRYLEAVDPNEQPPPAGEVEVHSMLEKRSFDPWDAMLTPGREDAGLYLLAKRGLREDDRARVHAWLDSGGTRALVAACRVVETLGDPMPIQRLCQLVRHDDPLVRRHAARALGAVADRTVLDVLAPLRSDPDPDVCIAAREAMAIIAGLQPNAAPPTHR